MRLTKAMTAAGIREIGSLRNFNGSYTAEVNIDKINIGSDDYNFRRASRKHRDEIVARFVQRATRNPILALNKMPNGKCELLSIDGRHTIAALKELGYKVVTCELHLDVTEAEGARIFYELTGNSKRMTGWEEFRAGVKAGEEWCRVVRRELNNRGFSIPPNTNPRSGDFSGPGTLKLAFNKGLPFLKRFLDVMNIWKDSNGLNEIARGCSFQRGLVDVLLELTHPTSQIIQVLSNYSASDICDLVNREQFAGRTDRKQFKAAILRAFNNKLKLAV